MEGMYINGDIRYNLISLVSDGVDAYTDALNDPNSGFSVNRKSHLKSLNGLIVLLDYLQKG